MALRADDVDLGRDRDLVERYQAGDQDAFDELYRRYFDRLHRFCRRHTRDGHEAEEVAQEAFVRALRSLHTLQGARRFYPWMTVIAKRISIDRYRKDSRVEPTDAPDLGTVEADLDHLFAEVDAAHVRAALANVGPRHRQVLVLREERGMSYAEIADHLEVPVTTVEALLHRARKALRREFAAVGGERRGLWAFPVLGLAATRLGQLRDRLADRWVEATAVAAPVAVGALTAAVVLAPPPTGGDDPAPPAGDRAAVAQVADTPAGGSLADPVELPVPAATGPASDDDVDRDEPGPEVDVGPVDGFVGPDGADRAGDEAEDMSVGGSVGPATVGVDPSTVVEDTTATVGEVIDAARTPARTTHTEPTPDPEPEPTPDQLHGGSR